MSGETGLLERAASLLRAPGSADGSLEIILDGSGLRCSETGQVLPYRNGILDLLGEGLDRTLTQKALDTSVTAWAYDRFRNGLAPLLRMPEFPVEVATLQERLQVGAGDVVLDLACGPGNFTVEWAKRAGDDGLVIGVDISEVMLNRAADHARSWGLDNVLLVRADAQRLPFADRSLRQVNCSGGFHQFPDLPLALSEIARVSEHGAVLTACMFAEDPSDPFRGPKQWAKRWFDLHFVPLEWLGSELESLGYVDYRWSLPGGWFGYTSARKKD
jgi:ubiquinone/menaquinone biosynthesis C-methylase UbiE